MSAHAPGAWATAAAYALGLLLTLVLAGSLTPRRWWRRPTAANLALAGAGTLAFGVLFCGLLAGLAASPPRAVSPATLAAAQPRQTGPSPAAARYRAIDDLNLRAQTATGARRLAVLPAGTVVVALGSSDGDWWRVRARVHGQDVEGWASSLWLRRIDEGRAGGER